VDISAEPEGYLSITVYDEDPQRAADIANFFVEMLDRVNREINAQNAHATRVFIEDRYQKNLADLAAAEDSLRAFQLRFGIIAMPEQTEETVKAGVSLAAELASKEVELSVLRRMVAKDHPSIVQKRIEVEELRKKIAELNNDAGGRDDEMRMMVPYRQIPDLGVAYVRRYREVQIQSKILEFLTPLYEQAKVEEKKESPSVIVLDRAGPAERKSSPKRSLIMLAGTLLGLIGAFVFGAASTRWADLRARDARLYHIVTDLLQGGRDDLRRFFTRRQDKGSL
jgi:capsule polysaccharide export protein KpsE/RkpR